MYVVCVCVKRVCVCVCLLRERECARARERACASRYWPDPLCLACLRASAQSINANHTNFSHLAWYLYLYDLVRCTIAPAHLRARVRWRGVWQQVLQILSSAFKMAPDVVRRTMQDATLRKEALRELRSSLGKTTPRLREGADSATGELGATPSAVSVPPLRKVDGSTAEETAKNVAKQDEAKAAEAKKKEEARVAEAKRKEEETKALEAKKKEEEARTAEAKRKEEEARATEAKRKEEEVRDAEAKRQEEEARAAEKKKEAKGAEANSKSGNSPARAVASPALPARSFFPSLDLTASFRSFNLNLKGLIQEANTMSEQLNKVAGLEEIPASAPQERPESKPALRGSESSEPSSVSSTQEPLSAAQAPTPESVGEWRAETDAATGNTYYWNTVTREVTWEKPKSD